MKTVEEAAIEYAHCIWESWEEDYPSDYECHKSQSIRDFKAGIEFSQQWKSVEDELPTNQDIVLVKTNNDCYATAYLHGKSSGFIIYGEDAYNEFGEVTHWRPIFYNY